jgi:anaerobic selenocysteine-containing dehydrogenase
MMGTLWEASRRGVPIVVLNPLKERALERFQDPQAAFQMATFGSTRIASTYFQVRAGGDAAALKGMMKGLLELDREQGGGVIDPRSSRRTRRATTRSWPTSTRRNGPTSNA